MAIGGLGQHAPAWRPLHEALLDQIGLDDLFEHVALVAERGRTEMMRDLGFAHSAIAEETDTLFTVRRCSVDYRSPARLDDALSVDTQIVEIGAATLLLDQQIRRGGEVLVRIDMLVACINRAGRPRRVPPGLRAALMQPAPVKPPIVQKTP